MRKGFLIFSLSPLDTEGGIRMINYVVRVQRKDDQI